jgi:hypothetical protein
VDDVIAAAADADATGTDSGNGSGPSGGLLLAGTYTRPLSGMLGGFIYQNGSG